MYAVSCLQVTANGTFCACQGTRVGGYGIELLLQSLLKRCISGSDSGVCAGQGLGFPDLTNMQAVPAFFNMISQGVLDAPTFSIYLNPDPAQEPSGQIEFGGYNTGHFVGVLNWAPVVDKACAASASMGQFWAKVLCRWACQ